MVKLMWPVIPKKEVGAISCIMCNLKVGEFLFPMRQCSLAIVFHNSLKYIHLLAKNDLNNRTKMSTFPEANSTIP